MIKFRRINSIKIQYVSSDCEGGEITYRYVLDGKSKLPILLYDTQDIATLLLKLYNKAKCRKNYRCCEELEAFCYFIVRIVNLEKDKILFQIAPWNGSAVECIMPRNEFLKMLEDIFDSLLADAEYIKMYNTFDADGATKDEIEEYYEWVNEHFEMLKERKLYASADSDIEDYNLDNPHNIFNR